MTFKWREENIKGDDVLNVFANPRDIDMCALSMCNHTIITVGSFGWWSAWLANGTTVTFDVFLSPFYIFFSSSSKNEK
jgi:galactoside 2-L-fucosyltransferase 1/2